MRIAIGVEYDGAGFHGWQSQAGVSTVQDALEKALTGVADHPVRLVCAGRTDAGVHATGQVAHFDTSAERRMRSWVLGANALLPPDVSVTWATEVAPSFHARFRAVGRHYRYRIYNRWARTSIERSRAVWVHRPLDSALMQQAASSLLGTHDFSSYRAQGCQAKSPVKTMHRLEVVRRGDEVIIEASANGFLHHMVRNIAGVLIAIGKKERDPHWAREVLALRDRSLGGVTAPPHGLYLTRVDYPPEYCLPAGGGFVGSGVSDG